MEVNKLFHQPQLKKAYLISLCLMANQVLAEQPDEKVVAEKALLDQVMDAVKNPGAEHMQIYAGLGVALAVIAGIVMMAFGKSDEGLKVTLDDVATDKKPDKKKASSSKKAAAKKSSKKTEKEDDWEDEGPIDKDALYKELDQEGPFTATLQGTLEPQDMIKLKEIVGKHAYIAFKSTKEEMMQERLGYFKKKQFKEYGQIIMKASQMFQQCNFEVTKLAAQFIDLDEANFEASMKQAVSDPAVAKTMQQNDENVRLLVEPVTNALSKDKCKAILMEKVQLEFDVEKRLANFQPKNQNEAQAVVMVERTKVMDALYIKHSCRLHELQHGIKQFGLDKDPEIMAQANAIKASRIEAGKKKEEDLKKQLKVSDEDQKNIDALIASSDKIDVTVGQDGMLAWAEYVKLFKLIVTLQVRYTIQTKAEMATPRRAFLEKGDKNAYAQCANEMLAKIQKHKAGSAMAVLDTLGIDHRVYQKTMTSPQDDPAKQQELQSLAKEVDIGEHIAAKGEGYVPLTLEEAIDRIEKIEMKKVEFMVSIIIASKMGQFPPQQMKLGEEMAKMQSIDLVHKENGVEESDIIIAFQKYNLQETPEFKVVIEKCQTTLNEKLQQAMQQIQAQQRAQQQQQMGGMPPGGAPGQPKAGGPRVFPPGGEGQAKDAADLGW